MYDYVIVGAGIFGSVFAYEASRKGKECLVIDKRNAIGGNVACEIKEDINIHKYGAHIFHTNDKTIWDYINQFAEFNNYINSPIANYKEELYNLPFNMNTFNKLWGVITPLQAYEKIEEQKKGYSLENPRNLEEQAISLVGKDVYEKLIKGYTEKQWGKKATELPSFIIKRLPVRFNYDNNYFNDRYQGIPVGGYNQIFEKMLSSSDVQLNTNFFDNRQKYKNMGKRIVYTGMIDEYFDYTLGVLEYRSLIFDTEILEMENYQGVAVMNYTDNETPYTRIIEHKHFEFGKQPKTVITKEFSEKWKKGDEPYYPINDNKNEALFAEYKNMADKEKNVIFGGRLADYKYYDMWQVIKNALEVSNGE